MTRQAKVFLLKIAARCNIDCDYCYEYRSADTSWRSNPRIMPVSVLDAAVERIKEHVIAHLRRRVTVILHGGEPLLAGRAFIEAAVEKLNISLSGHAEVSFGLQTNGTLLNEEWLHCFSERKIRVGVSVDGDRQANDRHRVDFRGRSTHQAVVSALQLLQDPRFSSVRGGLLGVIQPDSDPVTTFEWFRSWRPPQVDFLFPHYNRVNPPPYPYDDTHGFGFGLWLTKVFDHWWSNDMSDIKVRIFEDLMHLMLGGTWTVESFGLAPVELVVIQTGGAYEAVDSLKSTFDGAVATGKTVFDSSVDDVLSSADLIASRMDRETFLSDECRQCRLVRVCGGGYLPHRWSGRDGFLAPSVYSTDLRYLIEHIERALAEAGGDDVRLRLKQTLQPLETPQPSVANRLSLSAPASIVLTLRQ